MNSEELIQFQHQQRLTSIFSSSLAQRLKSLINQEGLVAHYTTAENGISILSNESLWLRSASLMNDFSEIDHGCSCLRYALRSNCGARLERLVDNIFPGAWDNIFSRIQDAISLSRNFTYITSLSEHYPHEEHGRLSMWRAYGGQRAGVALLFDPYAFYKRSNFMGADFFPVQYVEEIGFLQLFEIVLEDLERSMDQWSGCSQNVLEDNVVNWIFILVLTTKHPGFSEEREWRVINYTRSRLNSRISMIHKCISGIPQSIGLFSLESAEDESTPSFNINDHLRKILLGPCNQPFQVRSAFDSVVYSKGFNHNDQLISYSGIPLRPS